MSEYDATSIGKLRRRDDDGEVETAYVPYDHVERSFGTLTFYRDGDAVLDVGEFVDFRELSESEADAVRKRAEFYRELTRPIREFAASIGGSTDG